MNDCAIVLPTEENKWLMFQNYSRKEKLPFVVYADMECVLEKQPFNTSASTYMYQQHHAYSIAYYLQCSIDIREIESVYKSRRDPYCMTWFVNEMGELGRKVNALLLKNKPMRRLTEAEYQEFNNATRCHICNGEFQEGEIHVRDHCHLTGRYRGPAHAACNLNYRNHFAIPVFFHNLTGYDAHFIIEKISNAFEGKIELLPITKESYISFSKCIPSYERRKWNTSLKMRFVDSYKFLSESLQKLVSYLDHDQLKILRSQWTHLSESELALLARKGVFPYEYVDNVSKLLETELPPREEFHSSLNEETITESDYEHACNVWRAFRIRNLGEYSDLYLKTDVLLLADVFENFRDKCIERYGLDPAYYYTLPGYAWDAMLKYTDVRLELFTDIDMLMFVERGIRGGLSQCSGRYARANNIYTDGYDNDKPSTYLMYYDVNNLYGWAMCEALPHGGFEWVSDVEHFNVMSVPISDSTGYILEVDLLYPRELHDDHADLPFCPTREEPPGKRMKKLLATLHDKNNYVIHYRNLQQCISYGLRVKKIHRILRFSQSTWLSNYIYMNTQFRQQANNDFEKNMYKLMNNAVFGKTMENVRKHVDVRLVTRWDGRYGAEALISKPNFHSRSIFSEDLMAVELRRLEVRIMKPVYVGMCILELSKLHMYNYHYGYMKFLYGDNCKILYTDTDSFVYFIQNYNVYEIMIRDIDYFDTSDYPVNNIFNMPLANKKILGIMKDENRGEIMTEFVGLRAKMYAYRVKGRAETKKIKGIKRNVVTREITFDDFVTCLLEQTEQSTRQSVIRSLLHNVYTCSEMKVALSPHDDKRHIMPGLTDTLPWGHYSLATVNNACDNVNRDNDSSVEAEALI